MSGSPKTGHDAASALLEAAREPAELPAAASWAADLRADGLASFERQGLPNPRQEAWRFTPLKPLQGHSWKPAPAAAATWAEGELELPGHEGAVATLVDGVLDPGATRTAGLARSVRLLPLAEALASDRELLEPVLAQLALADDDPFTALNQARLSDGLLVHVPAGVDAGATLHLRIATGAAGAATMGAPRIVVVLGDGASLRLVEDHLSPGDAPALSLPVVEFALGEGARLDHAGLWRHGSGQLTLQRSAARLAAGARLESYLVCIGQGLLRHHPSADLRGAGAHAGYHGLVAAGQGTLVDNHSEIRHLVPDTTSEERFRHVLDGDARAVFAGRVLVAKDAQRTDAAQDNRTLLLSRDATVDTMPQLEIYADDVKCSHGATVGQLDEEQLFYLRTRGVPEAVARELLTFAFANEVVEELFDPAVRRFVADRVFATVPHEALEAPGE